MLSNRANLIPALLISILAVQCATGHNRAVAQSGTSAPDVSQKSLSFDVVSVKPNKTLEAFPGSMIKADGFYAQNTTPVWVMFYAYDLEAERNANDFPGLPDWAKSERFDIIAKVSPADIGTWKTMSEDQRRLLMRGILQDRFKLQIHVETSEQPIYALVIAKGGQKMQPVEVPQNDRSPYGPSGYVGRSMTGSVGQHATMQVIAHYLSTLNLGRPVQDRTGLPGNYNFILKFTPFPTGASPDEAAATPENSDRPFIFTALQEQLGLKLEPSRGPVAKYVIEHIERPSGN